MSSLSDKTSKRDQYLLKFQKYREEKEKQKQGHREQTNVCKKTSSLKSQNAPSKSALPAQKTPGTKLPQPSTTVSQSKENKKPISRISAVAPAHKAVNKPQSVKSMTQTNQSKYEPKTSSAFNVRKTVGQGTNTLSKGTSHARKSFSSSDTINSRKSFSSGDIIKAGKSVLNLPKNKVGERKSTGRIVESRLFQNTKYTNTKQGVSIVTVNKTNSNGQRKSRRHSDLHKKQNLTKPSILKRKSCFASFTCDGGSLNSDEGQMVGKTPDHGRSVRFISPDVQDDGSFSNYRKTPKRSVGKSTSERQLTPKHSAKKPRLSENAEQAAMRNKLDDWLKSKGKTPSKFRHLMCFHGKEGEKNEAEVNTDSCIKRSLTVEELTEQKATIDREESVVVNLADQFRDAALEELDNMLEECTTLFEAGCPREDILHWLDSIEQNIKLSKTYAKFYICKAEVLKSSENLDKVLQVYEEAVVNGAQPSSELAVSLTGIVKDICQEREKKARQRSAADVQEENIFESSAVVYTVRQVTPFSKKRRKSASDVKPSSPCAVVTPVRRSTRRSIAGLPSSLKDKTPTYKSLEDMSDHDKKKSLFFANDALEEKL